MRIIFLIILMLCCWIDVYSQHPTIELLKKFAAEADLSYYLDKAQQNLIDDYHTQCKEWGFDELPGLFKQLEINLHKERLVPILSVKFINTQNYNSNDNIYDYMVVDTVRNFMFACVNKKMRVKSFINYFSGQFAYCEMWNRRDRKLSYVIKRIQKRQPELLIYCSSLCGFHDENGFMFIKDNKIYICHIKENSIYELNDYIRTFFPLDRIRKLSDLPET